MALEQEVKALGAQLVVTSDEGRVRRGRREEADDGNKDGLSSRGFGRAILCITLLCCRGYMLVVMERSIEKGKGPPYGIGLV